MGVLRGEASREERARLHVVDELHSVAAVFVGKKGGKVGLTRSRNLHPGQMAEGASWRIR